MSKERGWWDLDLHEQHMGNLSDADRQHIAECVLQGCTGGELVESDRPDWDDVMED